MSVFYDLNKTPRNILNQAIVRAIISENNGALFDPSDLSTLYQDAAGTTPVTAVEQPVGLILDKSQGLMLGPELVSNGTFDSGIAGWEQKYNATTSYSLGSLKVMSAIIDANGAFAGQAIPTAIGRSYKVTFDLVTANSYTYIRALNNINAPWAYTYGIDGAAIGNKITLVFTATATVTYISFGVSGSKSLNAAVYDNISVREIYGNHATQSVTASRPTLSARYNLLTKTEDFSGWILGSVSFADGLLSAAHTDIDAYLRYDSYAAGNTTHKTNSSYTFSAECKKGTTKWVRFRLLFVNENSQSDVWFDLDLGIVGYHNTPITATIESLGDGYYKCTASGNSLATVSVDYLDIAPSDADGLRSVTAGASVYVRKPNLRLGTTPGPYQRVNTATDYDTDERYFKKYLRFDGVDDYLNLPYMGLYANGSASVVAAIDEPSSLPANQAIFAEGNSLNATPAYSIVRRLTSGVGGSSVADTGATNFSYTSPFISTPNTVESFIDAGNSFSFYRKSTLIGEAAKTTATTTLNNTIIGAINRGGVVQLFSRLNLYGLIITKSALTDSQRVACERYLGRKAGAQL